MLYFVVVAKCKDGQRKTNEQKEKEKNRETEHVIFPDTRWHQFGALIIQLRNANFSNLPWIPADRLSSEIVDESFEFIIPRLYQTNTNAYQPNSLKSKEGSHMDLNPVQHVTPFIMLNAYAFTFNFMNFTDVGIIRGRRNQRPLQVWTHGRLKCLQQVADTI